jgi:hypothetical protein
MALRCLRCATRNKGAAGRNAVLEILLRIVEKEPEAVMRALAG